MPSRLQRTALVALAIALATFVGTSLTEARTYKSYWFEQYMRAVHLIDTEQPAEALELLRVVIADNPVPAASVRIPGNLFIDYLPYYQTARAQAASGDLTAANRALDRAMEFGALSQSQRRHAPELATLREHLSNHAQTLPTAMDTRASEGPLTAASR